MTKKSDGVNYGYGTKFGQCGPDAMTGNWGAFYKEKKNPSRYL